MPHDISRRRALTRFAAGAAATPFLPPVAVAEPVAPAAADAAAGVCVLWPQAVEGPYYFDPHLERSDIRDGRPGMAVKLALKVIEFGSCAPLAHTRVDVWHADASGLYSGCAGQGDKRDTSTKGQTYLRGTQMTDAAGMATFTTLYPGWYPGRTPHIHVKAFLGETALVTGQIYFPDDVSSRIYREHEPYKLRPVADTTNATDGIFKDGQKEGGGIVFAISEADGLMQAALVIAVDRSGQAAQARKGWRGLIRGLGGR